MDATCDALALYVELFIHRRFLAWNLGRICNNFTDLWQRQALAAANKNADCAVRSARKSARPRNPLLWWIVPKTELHLIRAIWLPLRTYFPHLYPFSDSLGNSKVPDTNIFGLKRIFILTSRDFTGAFSSKIYFGCNLCSQPDSSPNCTLPTLKLEAPVHLLPTCRLAGV